MGMAFKWFIVAFIALGFGAFDWLLIRANNYPDNYDDIDRSMFEQEDKEEDDLK